MRIRGGVKFDWGGILDSKQPPAKSGAPPPDKNPEPREGAGPPPSDDAGVVKALAALNSELADAHRELARRNAQLDAAVREKNQLLGMAAHDLRNPLGVIVGVAELLSEELGDSLSEENRELLSGLTRSAEYMLALINDLLDYSKVEAGRLELQLAPVDLATLLRENVAFNSILAGKKGINLRLQIEGAPPPLLNLDSRRVQQVINNLVSNALKFSHIGTTVTVTMRASPAEVTIEVADQGQGIASDELDKLFKPFTSTRTRSTAGEKSTGLGLAIAHRIVQAHGGRIRVESEPGRGTTFFVTLPAAAPPASVAPAAR
jgi:signal transduction histidine kinase